MRLQNGRVTFRDGGRVWIYGKVRFLEISSFPFQTFRNRGLPKRESSTKQISQNFPVSINHIEYSNMIHFQRSQSNIYIYFHEWTKSVSVQFSRKILHFRRPIVRDEEETGPFSPQPGYTHTLHMSRDSRGPENGS